LPTTVEKDSLSQTPSPERNPLIWKIPYQASPTSLENPPTPGSPRRSAVMGPRTQPRPARNSYQSLIPSEGTKPSSPIRNNTVKDTRGKQSPSPRRAKSEAKERISPSSHTQNRKRSSHTPTSDTSSNTQPQVAGTQVSAIVPIWEDRSKSDVQKTPRRSTVSLVYDPLNLNEKSDASPKRSQADRLARMSSFKNSKHGCTTPAKKTVGLGIGAATPGSLYDGDGFLKE
jgi:hypothetical protein